MKKLVTVLLASIILMASLALTAAAQSVDIAESGATTLLWPVEGHKSLSRGFSQHSNKAIDISDSKIAGATIKAALGGTVVKKFTCSHNTYPNYPKCCYGYGTGLAIQGTDNRYYCYGHMQSGSIPSSIKVGSKITQGQVIGKVGKTGCCTGACLHFEICKKFWPNSGFVNPQKENYVYSMISPQDLGSKFYANIIANANTKFAVTANSKNNVYLGTLNYANAQKWLFERQSDKSYKITNVGMKKCLDLDDFGTANGTNIKVWTSNNSTAQRWFIIKNGSGYSIIPKCNQNSAMDINGAKYVNGRNINEWTRNTSTAQRFNITKTVDYKDLGKSFNAKIKSYNASFSVAANSKANVYLEKTANNTYQKWKFERQADMSYKITNVKTGKCLDVSGGKTANGTNIQVWKSNNSNAQRWFVVTNGKYYYLIPKCNLNGALDINGAKFVKGRNINEWTRNTSNAQKFSIVKV